MIARHRAEDLAPAAVIAILVSWIIFGPVVGYVWVSIVVAWLVIGVAEHLSHFVMVRWARHREEQRVR